MDGRGRGCSELIEGEIGSHTALEVVVMGGTEVAVVFRLAIGSGEARGRIGCGHHDQAGLGDYRNCTLGCARAARADGTGDRRVGSYLRCGGLPTFGRTLRIFVDQFNRMAQNIAKSLDRDLDTVARVDAQGFIGTGEDQERCQTNWIVGCNLDAAQIAAHRIIVHVGPSVSASSSASVSASSASLSASSSAVGISIFVRLSVGVFFRIGVRFGIGVFHLVSIARVGFIFGRAGYGHRRYEGENHQQDKNSVDESGLTRSHWALLLRKS